jgi:hypothetical protein
MPQLSSLLAATNPAKGVAARPSFERPFVRDKKILQREAKTGSSAVTLLAYAVVLLITLSILGFIAWALVRLATVTEGQATPAGAFRRKPAVAEPVPAA